MPAFLHLCGHTQGRGQIAPPLCACPTQDGTIAGNARRELEKKSGRKVVSRENYLVAPESAKRLRRDKAD